MIILNSVSKEFGKGNFKKLILDDINWVVPPRCRIVILGQGNIGTSMLLSVMAGFTIPTRGWVERQATVSVPGGLLRYSVYDTARQLIGVVSKFYHVDPKEVVEFVTNAMQRHDVLDVSPRRLPGSLRQQLNLALTYAFPCDFYLFTGAIALGEPEFRSFCQRAFELRSQQAGTIITANSGKAALKHGDDFMGGVLYRGRLTLYTGLVDAVRVFESLPTEEASSGEQPLRDEQEPLQIEEELF